MGLCCPRTHRDGARGAELTDEACALAVRDTQHNMACAWGKARHRACGGVPTRRSPPWLDLMSRAGTRAACCMGTPRRQGRGHDTLCVGKHPVCRGKTLAARAHGRCARGGAPTLVRRGTGHVRNRVGCWHFEQRHRTAAGQVDREGAHETPPRAESRTPQGGSHTPMSLWSMVSGEYTRSAPEQASVRGGGRALASRDPSFAMAGRALATSRGAMQLEAGGRGRGVWFAVVQAEQAKGQLSCPNHRREHNLLVPVHLLIPPVAVCLAWPICAATSHPPAAWHRHVATIVASRGNESVRAAWPASHCHCTSDWPAVTVTCRTEPSCSHAEPTEVLPLSTATARRPSTPP